MIREKVTIDANEAVAYVAYRLSGGLHLPDHPILRHGANLPMPGLPAAFPISTERFRLWRNCNRKVVLPVPHGALQTGSLTTTFTASQGLLLMILNMYKIAGELTPRSSMFRLVPWQPRRFPFWGSLDVMANSARLAGHCYTPFPPEAQDMALISQAATLEGRIPVLHFFDGFRTSHEVNKIEQINNRG